MANYEARLERLEETLGITEHGVIVVEVQEGEDPEPKIAQVKRTLGIDPEARGLVVVVELDRA